MLFRSKRIIKETLFCALVAIRQVTDDMRTQYGYEPPVWFTGLDGLCKSIQEYARIYIDANYTGMFLPTVDDVFDLFWAIAEKWPFYVDCNYMVPDPRKMGCGYAAAEIYDRSDYREMWLEGQYAAYREDLLRFVIAELNSNK